MNRRVIFLLIFFLIITSLACQTLTGGIEPTVTPAQVATPTLAPTATPDLNLTATTVVSSEAPSDQATEAVTPTPQPEGSDTSAPPTVGATDSPGGGGGGNQQAAACPAGGQNLLLNPSFEGEFKPFGAFTELNHAPNWFPWWQDGANNLRPEFKPAEVAVVPNRVHGGNTAQQYFKSFGQFKAGVYQSVLNVQPGSRLQFSAYGQAWSCEEFSLCPKGNSVNPANMLMRVGIDPTGDTDWSADTVKWSAYFNPLDQWQVACIEAVAEREVVTVFLWASPDGPRQNQDVYWDDASLVIIP